MEKKTKDLIKIALFANSFEWYDFAIFGFMAGTMGKLFFDTTSHYTSLLVGFSVFAVGLLVRPLGALIFGWIGYYKSTAFTLNFSLWLMATPSFLVGLLPTFKSIGILAPLLLILLRLIQGIGTGGEAPSAISFFDSQHEKSKRILIASVFFGAFISVFIASIVANIFSNLWRVPFLLSGFLLILIYWIRKPLYEYTPNFSKIKEKFNFIDAIKAIFVYAFAPLSFTLLFYFIPTQLHLPLSHYIASFGILIVAFGLPIGGWLSSQYNIYKLHILVVFVFSILLIIFVPFIYINNIISLIGYILIGFTLGIAFGIVLNIMPLFFENRLKILGIGVALGIAISWIGGTAPLLSTYVVYSLGFSYFPLLYIICFNILTVMFVLKKLKLGDFLSINEQKSNLN